jgi:hypothetical protein
VFPPNEKCRAGHPLAEAGPGVKMSRPSIPSRGGLGITRAHEQKPAGRPLLERQLRLGCACPDRTVSLSCGKPGIPGAYFHHEVSKIDQTWSSGNGTVWDYGLFRPRLVQLNRLRGLKQ